jgi:hypothetical protein
MRKFSFLSFLVFLSYYPAFSQSAHSSKAYVNTCFNKHQCFSVNETNGCFLFYNESNQELKIVLDFSKFRIGNDTLDAWLDDLDDTYFVFNGFIKNKKFLELSPNSTLSLNLNGIISFNNVSSSHIAELSLFEISNQGMLYHDNNQDFLDRVQANIMITFYPREFKIDKMSHHLKKSVSISIFRGYINQYKPEYESLFIRK